MVDNVWRTAAKTTLVSGTVLQEDPTANGLDHYFATPLVAFSSLTKPGHSVKNALDLQSLTPGSFSPYPDTLYNQPLDVWVFMSNSTAPEKDQGLTNGIYTSSECLDSTLVSVFTTIAYYNTIELLILCFTRFKKRDVYFWTLLVATLGIIPYNLGFMLKLFNVVHNNFIPLTFSSIGWYCMVTGQSMVLWSRLHLLVQNRKLLRGILYVIIIDAFVFHVPTTVLAFGTNAPSHPKEFVRGYEIMERIQLIGFSIQEILLSVLYIWETVNFLQVHERTRYWGILHQLLVIHVLIILMDASFVAVQYAGFYAIQVTFKGLIYSVKLKLEYAILGKLVKAVNAKRKTTELYPKSDCTDPPSIPPPP